jgi:hypothetical protein
MSVSRSLSLRSPALKLAAYGVVLIALLAGGAVVGAAVGPHPSTPAASHDEASMATPPSTGPMSSMSMPPVPAGLAIEQDGYRFRLATRVVDADTPSELRFVITGPGGEPVTEFDVAHDKQLHLVIVSRDLATYAHTHPERDASGTWTVMSPALPAGSYRVYADFVPTGHTRLTLAADLSVPGDFAPQPLPPPSNVATVDGYEITFDGTLVAGADSELTVTVSHNGAPVTDLDPYLGALGHLVAIRDGDLAYLHVHPLDELDGPGGPTVRFSVDVPTPGAYGLFFDFAHAGVVRNASVIVTAAAAVADGSADATTMDMAGDDGTNGG